MSFGPCDGVLGPPDEQLQRFSTVGATSQAIEFDPADGPIVVGRAFFLEVRWLAIGSGGSSESAGVAFASYFDSGTAISLIGSAQPLAVGVASISFGTTGPRSALVTCLGSAGQTLSWAVWSGIRSIGPMP